MDKPCVCGKEGCSSCNSEGSKMLPRSYVYAIGKVLIVFLIDFRNGIDTSDSPQA